MSILALGSRTGIVTGLVFEAEIARNIPGPHLVACHGPGPARAADAARELVGRGAAELVSFGVAGALDPSLECGAVFVATEVIDEDGSSYPCDQEWQRRIWSRADDDHTAGLESGILLSAAQPVITPSQKGQLHTSFGARVVDMETAAIAAVAHQHDLPFIALRVVLDTADAIIPPAALAGMSQDGRTDPWGTLAALVRRLGDLPDLLKLARADGRARKALARLAHLTLA